MLNLVCNIKIQMMEETAGPWTCSDRARCGSGVRSDWPGTVEVTLLA